MDETRNTDEEMYEPFLVYSRVADLVGNLYEEKRKLSVFSAVDKRLNLLKLLSEFSYDGLEAVRGLHYFVKNILSKDAFNRLIGRLVNVVCIISPETDEEFCEPYDNGKDEDFAGSGAR